MSSHRPTVLWSATPTPFDEKLHVDVTSVAAMIMHHLKWGIDGVMVGGTCGEGPWLSEADRELLIRTAVEAAEDRIPVAVQITDNSVRRMLEQAERCARWGASHVVVAQPYFLLNVSSATVAAMTLDVIRRSPLPVCFYDRGSHAAFPVSCEDATMLAEEKNVFAVKNTSMDPLRGKAYAGVRYTRPDLLVLNGDEFACDQALENGASGSFLGGAIINARLERRIAACVASGDNEGAASAQMLMSEFLWKVYGGRNISCWLAGLKYLLARLGIFRGWGNLLGYTLTDCCREEIDRLLDPAAPGNFRDFLLD